MEADTFGCRFFFTYFFMSTTSTMNAMKYTFCGFIAMGLCLLSSALQAQNIIEDEGVGIDRAELTKIVENWRPEMRKSAANDLGDRLELLNMALTNKKMARRAQQMSPESDPQAYWKYHFWLQRMQRKFVFDRFMAQLQVPDMSALAEERFVTEKDKYAKVSEQRRSSHILFMCPPGCDRTPIKPQAAELLAQLRAGADFEEMVVVHSQDPGTKNKKGKMNRWIEYGQAGITPNYSGGLFEIEEVGGYSEVVETEFGLHIIRLDEVRESYYLSLEEARESIVQTLEGEYRELAAKEFEAGFRVTDDVRIDGPAMDEVFGPYKTVKE